MRTVDEKFAYNKRKGDSFGAGYVFGVRVYRMYPKCNPQDKALIKNLIAEEKALSRFSDMQSSKGFMCGIRDAANERKAKSRK